MSYPTPAATDSARPLRLAELLRMKAAGEKIAMLTCYDASFAALCDASGVDSLLVGDSLGMVLQGHSSTLPVTMEQMVYHTECVARGTTRAWIVADMPFASYQEGKEQAFRNAARLMAAGAHMVKLEGGAWLAQTVSFLVERGIPVCGHIGLTPQSVHQLGGYKVQGRDEQGAARLASDAQALQEAGASLLVFEMVPGELAGHISRQLSTTATIGIGAGKDTDGQVLVLHDMLGVYPGRKARFVKNFMAGSAGIGDALHAYVLAVKEGSFPAPEHCY